MATIGEAIDKKAQEYIELYESFRADETFHDQAASLAKHDLIVQGYIYQEALVKVKRYIASAEGWGGSDRKDATTS